MATRYDSIGTLRKPVRRGRGGSTRLRADEAELVMDDEEYDQPPEQEPETKRKVMAKITLNGVEYEVEDNGLARDVASLKTLAETAKSEAKDAKDAVQKLEGER